MIGKLIGAAAGYQAGRRMRRINGPAGAALGAMAPVLLKRIGITRLLGLAAGGFLVNRALSRRS